MRASLIAAVCLVAASFVASPAAAQLGASLDEGYSGTNPSYEHESPSYSPAPAGAPRLWDSTLPGAILNGRAAVMKAYAEGQLSLAQARILLAEAKAREMQNRVILRETWLAREKALIDHRREQREAYWEWMDKAAEQRAERQETVLAVRYRLSTDELDRLTGVITWPAEFRHERFAALVEEIDEAFEALAMNGPAYAELNAPPIEQTCDRLRDAFRDAYRRGVEIEPERYLDGQSFLVGLQYEARYWPKKESLLGRVASR